MIKKYKKVFLTAFALICTLSLGSNVRAAKITENFNKKVGDSWDIGNGSPCNSSDNSVVSIADKKFLLLKTDNTLTCKKAGTAVVSCKADFWHNSKDAEYTVNCTAQTNQNSGNSNNGGNTNVNVNPVGYACRNCGGSSGAVIEWSDDTSCPVYYKDVTEKLPCYWKADEDDLATVFYLDAEVNYKNYPISSVGDTCTTDDNDVITLSQEQDYRGIGTYTVVNCSKNGNALVTCYRGKRTNKTFVTCNIENENGNDNEQSSSPSPSPQGNAGSGSTPSQTNYPVDNNRVSISEYAEKEVTLDPPSRATNTVTGTCEDYIVTEEGVVPGGGVKLATGSNYLYYSAKTNCTDNQGQEFVAFCVDPAQWGPRPTANYAIDKYIDPNDGEFSKGVVYVYKEFLKTGMSLMDRCAAENAIRYLEYDSSVSGGIATRLEGKFSSDAGRYRDAVALQAPLSGSSCATQAWSWYQAAKTASVSDVSEGYGVANVEIVPDSDYTQDDSGNISGHLLVQTPSGERINGNITITCPSGATCTDEGDGRIAISGTLSCGDNKLTAAVAGVSSDSNIKSALLVVNKKEPSRQRFVLFQTGGSASAGASFEFDGVKNCSTCQTSVNFACVPEGSYTNPIKLKEGTVDGTGDTDWAACVYNNNDEKGNTFNAFKNDYCVVSCTEEWDFRLPGNIQTVSGRNFSFTAQIGAKRTCHLVGDGSGNGVITPVNYRRADGNNNGHTSYVHDYNEAAQEMVNQYNMYLRQRAIVEAIEQYIKDNKNKKTLPTSSTNDCFGQTDKTVAKYEGKSEHSYYEGNPNLSLTDSRLEHPYTHIYSFKATRYNEKVKDEGKPTTGLTYDLKPNSLVDNITGSAPHEKEENECLDPRKPQTCTKVLKTCTENRYETYEDPNNKEYERTLRIERGLMETAYKNYTKAVAKIEEITEMYNECTDWENKYTFDPEIRFTYQEESYMDMLLQHQNKNYLINRKELEESRSAKLTTYDIDIAVGDPGTNLNLGSDKLSSGLQWPSSVVVCSRGFGVDGGMDIDGEIGDPVYAAADGTVTEAGYHYSYGNTIVIDHGNGIKTRYAHMADNSLRVAMGSPVTKGQLIGSIGNTGRDVVPGCPTCDGAHLHFEVMVNGQKMNPADYVDMSNITDTRCFGTSGGAAGDLEGSVFLGDEISAGPLYQIIREGTWDPYNFDVTEATYGESEVEYKAEETEYRSGVYFYTINPSGKVTTDKNAEGAKPLGYVYPVSLQTDQGDYPYYLNFGYVGMYNDSNRLGRIMGAAESSVLSGDAADYACVYNVCDPTMQDCPLQMCDVVTDGNGNTHYYDKEGNETDKDTHDKQCSSRDKVCTRETDENGNDVFCDANGNCSQDPSSYLKTCAKECAGYSLVGYNSYTGAEVDSSGRLQFLPKVVSLNNLFSAGDQSAKAINWQNAKAQAVRNEIESNGEKIFASSQYEFNLSPSAMAAIRNYNKEQENNDKGYGDFNVHCNEYGSDCQSYFLDNLSSMGVDVVKRDTSFTHDSKGYSYK